MIRKWKMSNWNFEQMGRRSFDPVVEDGCIINGCVPMDDFAEGIYEELENSVVAFGTLWEAGEMPVLKFDDAFRAWRAEQIEQRKILTEERITCLLPWQIFKHLRPEQKKSDRLYFTQGGKPSCMGHGDAFAHCSTQLQLIARGAPLIYTPFNPLVTWAITKGGSTKGGQTVSEMAKGANSLGHYPEHLVGSNNQNVPSYKEHSDAALQYQSAIMFLNFKKKELADEIIQCCAAGLSVPLGNGTAISGCTIDKNGVKVAVLRGTWAHATHATGYRVVNKTEYVGVPNSHGERYKSSDEGEPADMVWMSRELLEEYVSTAAGYGSPYVVFPESIFTLDQTLYVKTRIPFPDNWRF